MLRQRVITAAWLAPLSLVGLFVLEGAAFAVFTGLVVVLAGWEWSRLAGLEASWQRGGCSLALGATLAGLAWLGSAQSVWLLGIGALGWLVNLYWVTGYPQRLDHWRPTGVRLAMGAWVLVPTWVGFNVLRDAGAAWLLLVLLLVWGADIGAYFVGRALGRRKLAPSVSPGKTWEGVVGGLLVSSLLAVTFAVWQSLSLSAALGLLVVVAIVTLASVLGDLLESMLKRFRGLKDSSQLLPGHGGILDRIDSLTAAVPLFALLYPGGW
ncbi:phosphatidate cytidylyltransferase [Halomonas sp. 18H]|uniref:phosphatidate cytidylyltransferase n=1 Tax=Halomonas almeriensis TaxID=308163 RepID=UPI002230404C|nr:MULTISPECIES: phosphatidate cytidylyltransferase [Halomonas]MCW4149735.1 phosphatidate cytidylyltransferase [Halomonas sp. 18H]MDN3553320.1 phosphatidate cytidylyltransferase [Halomonas almeriensis]